MSECVEKVADDVLEKKYIDRIAELEAQIVNRNKEIIEKNQRMIELIEELQAVKAENSEYHGNAFGAAERLEELEDRHQSDCIEINRLNVALEVITEKYMKLREVHGL